MVAAMKFVIDENTPISRAAKVHGVPKSTLHNHISGNVVHGDKPGPGQLFSPVEEEELSNILIEVAQTGYEKLGKYDILLVELPLIRRKTHLMYCMGDFKRSYKGIHICHIRRVILQQMLQ